MAGERAANDVTEVLLRESRELLRQLRERLGDEDGSVVVEPDPGE